jgi:hypothetical protein
MPVHLDVNYLPIFALSFPLNVWQASNEIIIPIMPVHLDVNYLPIFALSFPLNVWQASNQIKRLAGIKSN